MLHVCGIVKTTNIFPTDGPPLRSIQEQPRSRQEAVRPETAGLSARARQARPVSPAPGRGGGFRADGKSADQEPEPPERDRPVRVHGAASRGG